MHQVTSIEQDLAGEGGSHHSAAAMPLSSLACVIFLAKHLGVVDFSDQQSYEAGQASLCQPSTAWRRSAVWARCCERMVFPQGTESDGQNVAFTSHSWRGYLMAVVARSWSRWTNALTSMVGWLNAADHHDVQAWNADHPATLWLWSPLPRMPQWSSTSATRPLRLRCRRLRVQPRVGRF